MDKKPTSIEVTKCFEFEAAHFLPDYDGPCQQLHGHTYKLEVTVAGELGEDGMIMDFVLLKQIVQDYVLNYLDHSCLNDLEAEMKHPTTAENIIGWIWMMLNGRIPKITERPIMLKRLKLWETSGSYVTLTA